MSAPTATRTLRTVPPCPPWCVAHQTSDGDLVHLSDRLQLAELALHLVRIGEAGEPVLILEIDEDGQLVDAIGDALSLDAAERLARALLEAVRAGRGNLHSAVKIAQGQECERCGHTFHPDSSPNLVLCWQCSEAENDPPEPWQQLDLWRAR